MQIFCTNCGAEIAEGKKFCSVCGTKIADMPAPQSQPEQADPAQQTSPRLILATPEILEPKAEPEPENFQQIFQQPQSAQQPAPQYTPPPSISNGETPPKKGSKYAPVGTFGYIGRIILFFIPVIGWIAALIMSFGKGNINGRNFSRAILVLTCVGIVIVAVAIVLCLLWSVTFTITLSDTSITFGFK